MMLRVANGKSTAWRGLLVMAMLVGGACFVHAADRVTLSTASGVGSIILTGRVVDWTGQTLTLQVAGDHLRELEAERVREVDTARLAAHLAGTQALAKGHYDEAVAKLSEALAADPRTWMRREILAELVRANLGQGDRIAAGTHFLAICESDPTTFWFDRIPLAWRYQVQVKNLDFQGASLAAQWMNSSEGPVSRLLGASLLLFHPSFGDRAAAVLEELAVSPDDRVFQLARAQRWRIELREGDVSEWALRRWTDRMREIPEPLRAGPRYLIGHAHARLGHPQLAATNWLWLPLVHDQNPRLAARAELLAADQLRDIGRGATAVVLYREITERFGKTPSGTAAKAALAALESSASPSQTGATASTPPAPAK